MKDLESMLSLISKGMSKKTAIILILTVVSILLSFSSIKPFAEELPVLVVLSLLTGFYIALYLLIFDIISWVFNRLKIIFKFLIRSSAKKYAEFKLSLQSKKKHYLVQRLFIEKVGENEIKYLSLFFGKSTESIKNQHGLIPKEVITYFEELCSNSLMKRETITNTSYIFSLDNSFAQSLQKKLYSGSQLCCSLTLNFTEIQANIVTTGGGLANGNTRT
ncbi:hypothetical protein ABIS04_11350 [Shewanella sp. H8]|uniref:hypothetical protein n=1 Tax=Shewanella sp. H8 TaxID=3342676 RepID=UPI003315D1E7